MRILVEKFVTAKYNKVKYLSEEYKKQKYYFFAKFFRNNLLSSKLCITFAPANKQWFARMAG